jgi:hypothetical protein
VWERGGLAGAVLKVQPAGVGGPADGGSGNGSL